jgi:hypothetical protein
MSQVLFLWTLLVQDSRKLDQDLGVIRDAFRCMLKLLNALRDVTLAANKGPAESEVDVANNIVL